MSIFVGSNESYLFTGTSMVDAVYVGADKLWPDSNWWPHGRLSAGGTNNPKNLVFSPDSGTTYSSHNSSSVIKFDVSTEAWRGQQTGFKQVWGLCISPDGANLYAVNFTGQEVSKVSTSSNTITNKFATPETSPRSAAISPDGSKLYYNNQAGKMFVMNTTDGANIATIPNVEMDQNGWGLSMSADGSKLYCAGSTNNKVTIIDTASNTVSGTITGFGKPHGLAVSPKGDVLLVANTTVGMGVSIVDVASSTITGTVAGTLEGPDVAISPDGRYAYAPQTAAKTVSVIDMATKSVVHTLAMPNGEPPGGGVFVSPDSQTIVASIGYPGVGFAVFRANYPSIGVPL